MTKILLRSIPIALFAIFIASAPASAAPITIVDTFDPDGFLGMGTTGVACTGVNGPGVGGTNDTIVNDSDPCSSLYFELSLGALYQNPPDTLTSATLDLILKDDNGSDEAESFTLFLDGSAVLTNVAVVGTANNVDYFAGSVSTQVSPDGMLQVFLQVVSGDFRFGSSTLNARFEDNGDNQEPAPVPEPASLLLFGAGAVMVGHRIRKARAS